MLPFGIGFSEVLLILVVILLVVGPQKLPDMAKTLGKGLRQVRRAGRDLQDAINIDDMKRQVYQPIREWERAQEIEEAELLEAERAEKAKAAAGADADQPAPLAEPPVSGSPVPEPPVPEPPVPEPPVLESPVLDSPSESGEDGPAIVARDPASLMQRTPKLPGPPTPDEDNGPEGA